MKSVGGAFVGELEGESEGESVGAALITGDSVGVRVGLGTMPYLGAALPYCAVVWARKYAIVNRPCSGAMIWLPSTVALAVKVNPPSDSSEETS